MNYATSVIVYKANLSEYIDSDYENWYKLALPIKWLNPSHMDLHSYKHKLAIL